MLKTRLTKGTMIRKCKTCGGLITKPKCRKFCCAECRTKFYYKKYFKYNKEWQKEKRGRFEEGKIQCLICKRWYNQIGSHTSGAHKMSARKYREKFGLDVKTGKSILSKRLHDLYGKQALENGTYKNLVSGEKYQFKKGDKKAGRYKRSPQTLERLKYLYKTNVK